MGKGTVALWAFGIIFGIIALLWFLGSSADRKSDMEFAQRDCFPLGVTWLEDKQDYDKWPPTGWDCSRTLSGDPKYGTD